jgi:hypothetical protein
LNICWYIINTCTIYYCNTINSGRVKEMAELSITMFSNSSYYQMLWYFQHTVFLCNMHEARYGLSICYLTCYNLTCICELGTRDCFDSSVSCHCSLDTKRGTVNCLLWIWDCAIYHWLAVFLLATLKDEEITAKWFRSRVLQSILSHSIGSYEYSLAP